MLPRRNILKREFVKKTLIKIVKLLPKAKVKTSSSLKIYQIDKSAFCLIKTNTYKNYFHTTILYISSLCANIETLESKCEELQKTVDDLNAQLEISRRRAERKPETEKPKEKEKTVELTLSLKKPDLSSTPTKIVAPLPELTKEDEDLLRLSDELRESKVAFASEQRRVTELEEQLASMVQENNRLHDQFRNWQQREDEPKSMHEEFSILEEVR